MPDELEFAISQYLDGTLAAGQVAELEARLQVDAVARELLEEYRRLDGVLKSSIAVPVLQWDRLAEHLSSAVSADVEHTEYAAIEFVDGTLTAAEASAFAARAEGDRRVAELVKGHRTLRGALKTLPKPDVRWDRLADHLYDTATGADRTYKLPPAFRWAKVAGGLAVAACALIVTSVGLRQHPRPTAIAPTVAQVIPSKMEIQIGGMDQVADAARPMAAVSIGGGGSDRADAGGNAEFAEGIVVSSSPRSLIATNAPVAQDAQMPY